MTAYKPRDHESLLRNTASGRFIAVLVYGPDRGGVSELAERIARAHAGNPPQEMETVTLDEAALKDDPGRLSDEARAISMFGTRRLVRLRDVGEAVVPSLEALADLSPGETLILVTAGNLKASSSLRRLFEKEKTFAAAPVYEDKGQDIHRLIRETLEKEGLSAQPDALLALSQILGADRALSRMELEKLALYCHGKSSVTLEDVRAVCGDAAAHTLPDLMDACFTGDLAATTRLHAALIGQGTHPSALLAATASHLNRLEALALKVADGEHPEEVVRRAQPPIFFVRRPAMIRQLRLWSVERLEQAARTVLKAMEESRTRPEDLTSAIVERCLLSLAIQARRASR